MEIINSKLLQNEKMNPSPFGNKRHQQLEDIQACRLRDKNALKFLQQ